ncbi:BglG family transcription antiterminator [Virgibacillus oceani]|uniref:LicABCH operon regulator n=1 Tax=Virgibacillus oceani TaxID=1479511 RepID=A0A917M8H9_9BACI|nr:BglG family transcription antiterminator [Virgibacillus oceani]GGG85976.1 putative licABCH operon regulator [Virgibacillus oceani]
MNSRWQEIIQLLMKSNDPMTSEQLAMHLLVSSKTVRNDIKELNHLLEQSDLKIESIRGKGYHLEITDNKKLKQFIQERLDSREVIPSEPEARILFLMEKLLLQSYYLKMDDLAGELYISRSTLKSDIKLVRGILEDYNLVLDQKPNYGIKVIGNETQIRFCISEYIFNQKPVPLDDPADWLSILSKRDLEIIKTSILSNMRKHNIIISDIGLQNLITHLAIACKRIRESNSVEIVHEELRHMKGKKEFAVASEIVQDVEAGLSVNFSENEVAYLAIHLQGTKLVHSNQEKENINSIIDQKVYNLVTEMVNIIDEKYYFNLSDDEELLFALCLHLMPAINRYKFQMNIRNPMLEEIKTKYPLSFEAALVMVDVLDEKMGIKIDENEIGYLALHLEVALERIKKSSVHTKRCLIVCASGLGSAQLLSYKLKNKFGDGLDIIGTTEYYNLKHQSLTGVDFIVSTIPITQDLSVPVIHVSTILGDSDVTTIETAITKDKSIIEQYMHEKDTFLKQDFETPEEVIRFLGNHLVNDGRVEDDYIDYVLERESYAPTSFGNLVAIPHPLEPRTNASFWSIVTLNKPIQWGDKPVQIVFLLNTNMAKKDDLKPMFHILVKLIDDNNLLQRLLQCSTFEQFKNFIIRR